MHDVEIETDTIQSLAEDIVERRTVQGEKVTFRVVTIPDDDGGQSVVMERPDGTQVYLIDVGRSVVLNFDGVEVRGEYAPEIDGPEGFKAGGDPTAGLNRIQYLVLQHANNVVRGN